MSLTENRKSCATEPFGFALTRVVVCFDRAKYAACASLQSFAERPPDAVQSAKRAAIHTRPDRPTCRWMDSTHLDSPHSPSSNPQFRHLDTFFCAGNRCRPRDCGRTSHALRSTAHRTHPGRPDPFARRHFKLPPESIRKRRPEPRPAIQTAFRWIHLEAVFFRRRHDL